MSREQFEAALRYYLWGGKESYSLRQQLTNRTNDQPNGPLELPAWKPLVQFAGIAIDSPQSMLECAYVCKEIALRYAVGPAASLDEALNERFSRSDRVVQFSSAMSNYLTLAGPLPRDVNSNAEKVLFGN